MYLIKYYFSALAICLWLGSLASAKTSILHAFRSNIGEQAATEISNISEIINRIADESNYRSVKAVLVEPDQWNADKMRQLLVEHAHYTLFSRDPDSLQDLGPMHRGASDKRINVTILVFKAPELAAKEIERLKVRRLENMGAKVIRSDANGFHVRTALRSQMAVRQGVNVVLLETDKQEETMKTIAARLEQASW